MIKYVVAAATAVSMSVPSAAQPAPQANAEATQTPAPQAQTVKKKVCTRVVDEEATGSRLSNSHKVCKMVDVPATSANGQQASASADSSGK